MADHSSRRILIAIGLWCISASAQALPSPLLGPDGPFWLGTITPNETESVTKHREWVTVDPKSGLLNLEKTTFEKSQGSPIDIVLSYQNGNWQFNIHTTIIETPKAIRLQQPNNEVVFPKKSGQAASFAKGDSVAKEGISVSRSTNGWTVQQISGAEKYDDLGRLIEQIDPYGVRTIFVWETNRLHRIEGSKGSGLTLQYDAKRNISVIRSDQGRECYFDHQNEVLIASSCNDGSRSRYLYTQKKLRGILWQDGSRIHFKRNKSGQIKHINGPGSRDQRYRWERRGIRITTSNGGTWNVRFKDDGYTLSDPDGRQTSVNKEDGQLRSWTDPSGNQTQINRDASGLVTGVYTGGIGRWKLGWKAGALTSIQEPTGATWTYKRNTNGALIALRDPDGVTRHFKRDASGQIRSIQEGSWSTLFLRDAKGRIEAIRRATGAETSIERNPLGHITAFSDAGGNRIGLQRNTNGEIQSIKERTTETWRIQQDSMGRTLLLETPTGGRLRWKRSSQGSIAGLSMDENREIAFSINQQGLPTRIASKNGRTRGLVWSSAGKLRRIRLEDGSDLHLDRDAYGRIRHIRYKDTPLKIERNIRGLPEKVGPLRFKWNANRGWSESEAPGISISLNRSDAGRVKSINYGKEKLSLQRDPAGNLIKVSDTHQDSTIVRNPNGTIVGTNTKQNALQYTRDVRGLISHLKVGDKTRRILYDAAGRKLRTVLDDGSMLSTQYDREGRPSLIRYANGAIGRYGYGPLTRYTQLEDNSGQKLFSRNAQYDAQGLLTELSENKNKTHYHRDQRGNIVNIEAPPKAWSWLPDGIEGPDDYLLEHDSSGLPSTLRLPLDTQIWGNVVTRANYTYQNRLLQEIKLNDSTLNFQYDSLGRPVRVSSTMGRFWTLQWGPLGHLKEISSNEKTWKLHHSLDHIVSYTESNELSEIVVQPGYAWMRIGKVPAHAMLDDERNARIIQTPGKNQRVDWNPMGMPSVSAGPIRHSGSWAGLGGGLILDRRGGIDPLSGARLHADWQTPWQSQSSHPARGWDAHQSRHLWWSPDPWIETTPFSNPIQLLVDLNELDPMMESHWTILHEKSPPLPWLPLSANAKNPPLGPPANALPIQLSELERACLIATYGPIQPLSSREIGMALLREELEDLPNLSWLSTGGQAWWLFGAEHWLDLP